MTLGVNFTNMIHAAFMLEDPKSKKKNTVTPSVFFLLSGSACAKDACRTLMKLTLGLDVRTNLINLTYTFIRTI